MNLLFLDTETTELEDPRIIQLAYRVITKNGLAESYQSLYKPEKPSSFTAMGTHGITPEMTDEKLPFALDGKKEKLEEYYKDHIFVAHNAEFDIMALEKEGVQRPECFIDTRKVAYYFLPDQENWRLQTLCYSLGIYKSLGEQFKLHDAMTDVLVMEKLFKILYKVMTEQAQEDQKTPEKILDRMITLSGVPLVLREIPFGEHKGKKFKDVLIGTESEKGNIQEFDWFHAKQMALPKEERNEDFLFTLQFWWKKQGYEPEPPKNAPQEGEVQVTVKSKNGFQDFKVAINPNQKITTLNNGDEIYRARTSSGKSMQVRKSGNTYEAYFAKR